MRKRFTITNDALYGFGAIQYLAAARGPKGTDVPKCRRMKCLLGAEVWGRCTQEYFNVQPPE